jgi:tRNA A-37 threonylcarbamoyl transferase component Bud32
MSTAATNVTQPAGTDQLEPLAAAVRRGLQLDADVPVSGTEVIDFTNINYVYRVEVSGKTLYLKVIPERPKRFPVNLSRERVFSEAEGLRRFRSLVEGRIIIPEVLFVDRQEMALGMSDVGQGREVLFSVIGERFDLLNEQAEAFGEALGLVHRGTKGAGSFRPAQEEQVLRGLIFQGLLAPGAQKVFPESWDGLNEEMQAHLDCLIHSDLWSKNILVRQGEPAALVDFEGVCYGDPAFDLATLSAVALLPALERKVPAQEACSFILRLLKSWIQSCGSVAWANEVLPRTFRATACFLATRGFGPFAYPLADDAKSRLTDLARSMVTEPARDLDAFLLRVAAM